MWDPLPISDALRWGYLHGAETSFFWEEGDLQPPISLQPQPYLGMGPSPIRISTLLPQSLCGFSY